MLVNRLDGPGLSLGYLELRVFGGVVGRRETTLVTSPGKRRVPFATLRKEMEEKTEEKHAAGRLDA